MPVQDYYGFQSQNILLLVDDGHGSSSSLRPTRKEMFNAMQWLVKGAQMHDSLFFHCEFRPPPPPPSILLSLTSIPCYRFRAWRSISGCIREGSRWYGWRYVHITFSLQADVKSVFIYSDISCWLWFYSGYHWRCRWPTPSCRSLSDRHGIGITRRTGRSATPWVSLNGMPVCEESINIFMSLVRRLYSMSAFKSSFSKQHWRWKFCSRAIQERC